MASEVATSPNADTDPDTATAKAASVFPNPYDSLAKVKVDTTTLEGKRKYILDHFLVAKAPSAVHYESLFDLNYDGAEDYGINYYAEDDTGLKRQIRVYLYNSRQNCYLPDEQLSGLSNPSFYLPQKKITWFYIGDNAGQGGRLEWKNDRWDTTETFTVSNQGEKTEWRIHYPLQNKTEKLIQPFQMVPPKEVLETAYALQ